MKKIKLLYITSLSGKRINGFMRSAILAATECGIDFTMACNMDNADKEGYVEDCKTYGIKVLHVDFDRNPLKKKNLKAYQQLCKIMIDGNYDIVHCNTPIGGVLGRICAHENKIPTVIYQAHGFHFWTGAPLKNWMLYYPVERLLAHWTDILITINKEDYGRGRKFPLRKNGELILHPGVGVDIDRFKCTDVDCDEKRNELGIKSQQFVFLTVGELIERKNHSILIKAMKYLKRTNAYLLIAGAGEKKELLQKEIEEAEMQEQIKLLGYRSDVKELLKVADCFLFPSYQEGLPGALMEAMASGLPCIASKIRGNTDVLADSEMFFEADDFEMLAQKMILIMNEGIRKKEAKANEKRVQKYDIKNAIEAYKEIYNRGIIK